MPTPNMLLPTMAANTLQPSADFNAAMQLLDAVTQLVVTAATATPPTTSAGDAGKLYIINAGATGVWAGRDGKLALCTGANVWTYITPQPGWYGDVGGALNRYSAGAWSPVSTGGGGGSGVVKTTSPNGAATELVVIEELLTMTGATVTSTIQIPNRGIVLGVSSRTVTAITGATSYSVGLSGEVGKFGSLLSVSAGGTNMGVVGPQAFYADTPIILTPAGGNFTGGTVRIAIHAFKNNTATS